MREKDYVPDPKGKCMYDVSNVAVKITTEHEI